MACAHPGLTTMWYCGNGLPRGTVCSPSAATNKHDPGARYPKARLPTTQPV